MKKIFSLLILTCLVAGYLFSITDNVAILGFEAKDKDSKYISTFLEKRDLNEAFKDNANIILLDLKATYKAAEELKLASLDEMEPEQAIDLGKKLNAQVVVWGHVLKDGQEFRVVAKVLSIRTQVTKSLEFKVVKERKSRAAALKADFVDKIIEFNSSELKKIFSIAEQNYNAKSYVMAIEGFLKYIEIDPSKIESYLYLGLSYFLSDKFDKSVEACLKGLAIDPNNEKILDCLAAAYQKQNKYDDAIKALERFAIVKSDEKIWMRIATMYNEQSKFDQAETALDKAIAIKSDYDKAHYLYALIAYDKKEYDRAIPHLEFCAKAFPDDDEISRKLAISYQKTGKLQSAIDQYSGIIQNDPNNTKAYLNLAAAYRALATEKPSEAKVSNNKALEALNKAKALDSENAKIYIRLADVYIALDNLTACESNCNIAIQKDAGAYESYMILGLIAQKRGFTKFSEYLDLAKLADGGTLYGAKADKVRADRDNAKQVAYTFFKKAEEYFNTAKSNAGDNISAVNDLNAKIQTNLQYLNKTKKGFMD